ncbi:S1-C subfamily serine protease [Kribbella sp. VKM Ac-2527]|uniref:S1-C subfamily serine protease n=1 Tax=Kribbella caucasensis TaxID=2512215 RepID=A0A4R6K968_9ACTN|nr:trypsin-like peptidase domain-containing protein [Kribbella sp. VKM Ac-2527]TDO45717.1 S1-C subfamily serine protease [Kribbella sp. VKM Ac-2527]
MNEPTGQQGDQPYYGPAGGQSGGQPQYGQPGPEQYGQPGPQQYGQPGPQQYGQPGPQQYGQPGPQQYGQPGYGPWGGYPQGPFQQPPKRRKRLPLVLGSVGLALALVGGSVAWGIDQRAANSSQVAAVMNPSAVAAEVSPGLVDVNTVLGYEGARAAGTGIVLTSDGEILTNHHVIEGATEISVTAVATGKVYKASVVGYDESHDIAVLKLQDASGLETAKIGDSSEVKLGDQVVGVGNAGGDGGEPSYTAGQVTGLNESITATDESGSDPENLTGLIETNADIVAGYSGGPLVNSEGEVIGVDTAGSSTNGNSGPGQTAYSPAASSPSAVLTADGFGPGNGPGNGQGQEQESQGYAVPINQAMEIADQIEAGNASSTIHIGASAMLGISVANVAGIQGAAVNDVVADGKADEAGLSAGDVITEFGGKTVDSPDTLSTLLDQHHPGDKVSVTWVDQSGERHTATIELITGPVR